MFTKKGYPRFNLVFTAMSLFGLMAAIGNAHEPAGKLYSASYRPDGDRWQDQDFGYSDRYRPFNEDGGQRGRDSFDRGFDGFDFLRRNDRPVRRELEYPSRTRLRFDDERFEDNGRFEELPAPVRVDEARSEWTDIREKLVARYQSPVNVRFARALSAEGGIELFAEISRLIDERHLEPVPYADRVRRALRHISAAMEDESFLAANNLRPSEFQVDGMRHELSSLLSRASVRNSSDAVKVMRASMAITQKTVGLRPGVVAYEFVSASTEALDKYSAFEPKNVPDVSGAVDPVLQKTAGALDDHVVGIGVEVKHHEDGLLIEKTLAGGPAREAGLRSGDVIVSVNGKSLAGRNLGASVDLIAGREGSPVLLGIRRGERRESTITLRRRRVRVLSVNDVRMLDRESGVAYLRLDKFARSSSSEMDQALWRLYRQGMKSLVIDVRGNPGGLLTTAIEVSNKFLPCGTIVSTRGRRSSDNMHESATLSRTWKTPLVVLSDGDSASASEIFAAAIQENGRGVVVGSRSYGKGTVQTHFPLSSVSGNLRLTTARFYSPNGRPMSGNGVNPDVDVDTDDGSERQILAEAVRIARHPRLLEMAQASRSCRPRSPQIGRSGSLDITVPVAMTQPGE